MKETKIEYPPAEKCGGCGVMPGKKHKLCDWERCPLCGGQIIVCDCIYKMCLGEDVDLEHDYPAIYAGGPTEEMYKQWDKALKGKWVKHDGHYPGTLLAVEQGWYSRWEAVRTGWPNGGPWIECKKDHPDATPDLNKAAVFSKWDADKQRLVLR